MSKEAVNAILGLCADHAVVDSAVVEAAQHVSGLHPWRDNVDLVYVRDDTGLPNPLVGTVVDAFDGATCEAIPFEVFGCQVVVTTPCYLRISKEGTVPDTVADNYAAIMAAMAVNKDVKEATQLMQDFLTDLDDYQRIDQITAPTKYEFKTAYLVGKVREDCKCDVPVVEPVDPVDPIDLLFEIIPDYTPPVADPVFAQLHTTGGSGPQTWSIDLLEDAAARTYDVSELTVTIDSAGRVQFAGTSAHAFGFWAFDMTVTVTDSTGTDTEVFSILITLSAGG